MDNQETICNNCGDEIDMMDEFDSALHSLVTLSHNSFESPIEVISVGLGYFLGMAYDCAPDEKAADELIKDIITWTAERRAEKEDTNNG